MKSAMLYNALINNNQSFTFETALSTDRNLKLLQRAKEKGYFIRCIYVLNANPQINVSRIFVRTQSGGHDVPKEKIISRYDKALKLVPQLLDICDVCYIYDNPDEPQRIFKKRKSEYFYWENAFWNKADIEYLTKITFVE